MKKVSFSDITAGGFWQNRMNVNREFTLPNIYDRFKETGRFDAFKCEWREGDPLKPHFFWDSDVAKWIEAAAYSLSLTPDKKLEKTIDDLIDLIEKNQTDDGYFNIYFTVVEPGKRFTIRDYHELYCAGHLIEAAIAYCEATGKAKMLNLMKKYSDLIYRVFYVEHSAAFDTPGHEEIELALIKLYEYTGEEKYLTLSGYFIETRGNSRKDFAATNWYDCSYYQADRPVRDFSVATGHCVRAVYLYSAMADYAGIKNDTRLLNACERVFDNIYYKQMYVTGGIGSTAKGEAFTEDYVLPNDLAYSETCASIGLALFARRMSAVMPNSKYADCAEIAIYNCALAGVSLDGTSFFYVNPLEININKHRLAHEYYGRNDTLLTQRVRVFDCSCCPPNIARFVASIGDFLYNHNENTVYVHHFMQSEAEFDGISIKQDTDYPNDGRVKFTVSGMKGKRLAVRIPGWCNNPKENGEEPETVCDGYAYTEIERDNQTLEFNFEMSVQLISANPQAECDAGRVCVCRGPLVYCAESVFNDGINLNNLSLRTELRAQTQYSEKLNANILTADAYEDAQTDLLYRAYNPDDKKKRRIKLLPYFAYANNGESNMIIWFREGE